MSIKPAWVELSMRAASAIEAAALAWPHKDKRLDQAIRCVRVSARSMDQEICHAALQHLEMYAAGTEWEGQAFTIHASSIKRLALARLSRAIVSTRRNNPT